MGTVYPGAIDSFTTKQDLVDTIYASHINDPQDSIVAIETELGINPKGTYANVAARLAAIEAAGGWDPWELVSDDFTGSTPKPQWRIRNSDLGIKWDPTNDRIELYGTLLSQARPFERKGILGQWARGDFDVRFHFDWTPPATNSRYVGIIAMINDYNYVMVFRGYYGGQGIWYNHSREDGESEVTITFSAADFWLRIVRTGSTFTAFYSTDGTNYTQLPQPASLLTTDFDCFVGVWCRQPLYSGNPPLFLEFQSV
jgi:hypothetical protein